VELMALHEAAYLTVPRQKLPLKPLRLGAGWR
jgi:hypothetical protein